MGWLEEEGELPGVGKGFDVDAGFGSGMVPLLAWTWEARPDEDALGGFAAGRNKDALGEGRIAVAHCDGDFGGGVAGVGEVDGDDPRIGVGT